MTVTSITPITDHVQRAIDRLPQQYTDAPKSYSLPAFSPDPISGWEGVIYSFVQNCQTLEDTMNSMLSSRSLTTATGVNLDRLGEIVGATRNGLSDADYLTRIYIQIGKNNSDGTAFDIISIWQLVITAGIIQFSEIWPAKFQLYLQSPDPSTDYDLIREATEAAKAAGVGFLKITVSSYLPVFVFDSDPDPNGLGFSVIGGDEGGYYSIIIT